MNRPTRSAHPTADLFRRVARALLLIGSAALIAGLLTLWIVSAERAAGQPPTFASVVGYWHPLLSLMLGLLIGVMVLFQRRLGDVAPLLVLIATLIAAAPERVPLTWYPYTTAGMLVLATAALTSYLGSRPRPGGKAWENR